jgi:hypothetical protein
MQRIVEMIDWHAAANSRSEWFLDDVHPSVEGVYAFADMLANGMRSYVAGPFRSDRTARRLGLRAYPTDR